MPTKTTSKTARKPAAHKTAKGSAAHKAKPAAAKAKGVKKPEPAHKPAAKPHAAAATKAHVPHPPAAKVAPKSSPTPRREVESVSLIDEKKPKKKGKAPCFLRFRAFALRWKRRRLLHRQLPSRLKLRRQLLPQMRLSM